MLSIEISNHFLFKLIEISDNLFSKCIIFVQCIYMFHRLRDRLYSPRQDIDHSLYMNIDKNHDNINAIYTKISPVKIPGGSLD